MWLPSLDHPIWLTPQCGYGLYSNGGHGAGQGGAACPPVVVDEDGQRGDHQICCRSPGYWAACHPSHAPAVQVKSL